MAHIVEVFTGDNLRYQFFPMSSGYIRFKVRAYKDAHIALTMGPQPEESDPMVEVFIGGWENTKSVIRRNRTKPDMIEVLTPGIMSMNEFRGFWIQCWGGVISAGREGELIPFVTWTDPTPIPVAFVGVCTGWGATGIWRIETSPVILKPLKTIKFTDGSLEWVSHDADVDELPPNALIGGFEYEPLYIARSLLNRSMCPGKYIRSHRCAYLPWGGREFTLTQVQILTGYDAKWVKTNGSYIPENAFIAGFSEVRGEPLYIGRAMFENNCLVGKVHTIYDTCYLPYKGREIEVHEYEILVTGDEPRGVLPPTRKRRR